MLRATYWNTHIVFTLTSRPNGSDWIQQWRHATVEYSRKHDVTGRWDNRIESAEEPEVDEEDDVEGDDGDDDNE